MGCLTDLRRGAQLTESTRSKSLPRCRVYLKGRRLLCVCPRLVVLFIGRVRVLRHTLSQPRGSLGLMTVCRWCWGKHPKCRIYSFVGCRLYEVLIDTLTAACTKLRSWRKQFCILIWTTSFTCTVLLLYLSIFLENTSNGNILMILSQVESKPKYANNKEQRNYFTKCKISKVRMFESVKLKSDTRNI